MRFSKEVREQALIAAARHCCVCHHYKGVNVEVHHIVPRAEGGSETADNAIALCFDCHADAGHYNPEHPRGSKFSPDELRKARDRWYDIVSQHQIQPPKCPGLLYCRYLICKDFEALREICADDFTRIPVTNPFLVQNASLAFLRKVVNSTDRDGRRTTVWGESWPDEETYLQEHPDLSRHQPRDKFPYFHIVREPAESELRKFVSEKDSITAWLMAESVEPSELARVCGYWELCGEHRFQEVYRLRPLWGAFLAVTNISNVRITLESLKARSDNRYDGFREFKIADPDGECTLQLPKAPIPPDGTVIIPIATVMAPFASIDEGIGFCKVEELGLAQVQSLTHAGVAPDSRNYFRLWGPAIYPVKLAISADGKRHCQELYSFDLENIYTIDRNWRMGSCPHVFIVTRTGAIEYVGELLGRAPFRRQVDQVEVPSHAESLIIAELEEEITRLDEVVVDGERVRSGTTLNQGEMIVFSVRNCEVVRVTGWYRPRTGAGAGRLDPVRRNELITRFIHSWRPEELTALNGA